MPHIYEDRKGEAETLEIFLEDLVTNINLTLIYSTFYDTDIITRCALIQNSSSNNIILNKAMSVNIDFMYGDWELVHFYGKHAMEREFERTSITHGIQTIRSTRGTSSHHHNPFIIICDKHATEQKGDCYGLNLVYSGGFVCNAEYDQVNQLRVNMGIDDDGFEFLIKPKDVFQTPEVVMTYSEGFGKLSHNYHNIYRNNLCRGKYKLKRRPILINNWEATYFDFNTEKLISLAKNAKKIGIEMLVMDDGWFGERNSDNKSLGDWFVNTDKLKGGLKPLVDKVNKIGLKFGIWLEPEMISENSQLYKQHPEWVLQIPNRKPTTARSQLVLDMSRKDTRDYLFNTISDVLDSANIEYIKWDMNRSICNWYGNELPKERQGELPHRYVLGLYDLLERITTKYPNVLFEGCSGGGGRFDPGMLYYSPQIWCSDNTDAIERLKIQYGTSFAYPISTVGSHISASPNHQTGRITQMTTRGIVAMSGSFGFEVDLAQMTEQELLIAKQQTKQFKILQNIIHNGDYYRLTNPYENNIFMAWQFVSSDKTETLVNIVILYQAANAPNYYIKLQGLDENKIYCLDKKLYSGNVLMNAGFLIPNLSGDYASLQLLFKEV